MAKRKPTPEEIRKAKDDFEYLFTTQFYPKYSETLKKGIDPKSVPELVDIGQELVRLSDICGIVIEDYHAGFNAGICYKTLDDSGEL